MNDTFALLYTSSITKIPCYSHKISLCRNLESDWKTCLSILRSNTGIDCDTFLWFFDDNRNIFCGFSPIFCHNSDMKDVFSWCFVTVINYPLSLVRFTAITKIIDKLYNLAFLDTRTCRIKMYKCWRVVMIRPNFYTDIYGFLDSFYHNFINKNLCLSFSLCCFILKSVPSIQSILFWKCKFIGYFPTSFFINTVIIKIPFYPRQLETRIH